MSEPLAAKYLGVGTTMLREDGPKPKHWRRRVLYDRHDLDRWADALDGQPLDESQRDAESTGVLARVHERLGRAGKG